jgi:hypothetical protein
VGNEFTTVTVTQKGEDFKIVAWTTLGRKQVILVDRLGLLDATAIALAFAKAGGARVELSAPGWLVAELEKAGHDL